MNPIIIWHPLEVVHDVVHAIVIPVAIWMWNERRVLKAVLEDKLERRHNMGNPIADIQLALGILAEVRAALPIVGQAIADFKQAYADKGDPTKAAQDLSNALTVLEPLVNQVLALVPAATPTTPPPAPAAAA